MESAEQLRKDLISRIKSIDNVDLLALVGDVISDRTSDSDVKLSPEQEEMLKLSVEDLEQGRVISHDSLNALDREWLSTR